MIERITISMSTTEEELWETQVKLDAGFDKILMMPNGSRKAFNIDDELISVWVPSMTPIAKPVTEDNMDPVKRMLGTPDGEPVIEEASPTEVNIMTPVGGEFNPLIPPSTQHR
jgi:hypothetical protein